MLRSLGILCFATALSLAAAGEAHASCSGNACSHVTITRLYVPEDPTVTGGMIWIATSGDETALSNCSAQSNVYIGLKIVRADIGVAENNFQQVYQMLLAAELSGREVTIRTNDGGGTCEVGYVWME